MTNLLMRRLRGLHALLEMALEEERSRPRPDDRILAAIKKKKLAIKDRLSMGELIDGGRDSFDRVTARTAWARRR